MRSLIAAVLFSAVMSAATPALAEETDGSVTLDRAGAAELLAHVNAARAVHGVPPVTRDPALEEVAIAHTLSMARAAVLRHNDSLFTRASHERLGIKIFAENVGYDWSVAGSHEAYMGSRHHRENLLGRDYRLAGFAVVRDARGAVWTTEDFGTPRVASSSGGSKPAARPAAAPVSRPAVAAPSTRRVAAVSPAPRPAGPRPAPARPGQRPVVPAVVPPALSLYAVRDVRERPAGLVRAAARPSVPADVAAAWPLLLVALALFAFGWLPRRGTRLPDHGLPRDARPGGSLRSRRRR